MDVLTKSQRAVADRVLAEEDAHRRHIVVSLSGAHAYGFPSPDSDLDLKAVHAEPTSRLLGLAVPAAHASRFAVIDGVEVDYSSNELQAVCGALLGGNGNYFERFLSAIPMRVSPEFDELRPLVRRALSKRIYRHYAGFARSQFHEWEKGGFRSAKKLLYVLRTSLTGTHVLRTGELETDLTRLVDDYGLADARELVEAKKRGERAELEPGVAESWKGRVAHVLEKLDAALTASALPDEAMNAGELEAWLVDYRRRSL